MKLEPEKNAVQNAQSLYKRHQKNALAVLWNHFSRGEGGNRVFGASGSCHRQMDKYQTLEDGSAQEIREELIQQRYLEDPGYRSRSSAEASSTNFQRYHTLATLKC